MYSLIKPWLFAMDAEDAHDVGLGIAERMPLFIARRWAPKPYTNLVTAFLGHRLAHPLGLAAGMDKNGVAIPFWEAIGFSFAELGTVTPFEQKGNPRPRLFRLSEHGAIINRMGFNNHGAVSLARRLERWSGNMPIGVSIGKGKDTPLEQAADDYAVCTTSIVDVRPPAYFAINVSSPNTVNLRKLQGITNLARLISAVHRRAPDVPIAVKIAPDMTDQEAADIATVCVDLGVAAIIATNTTTTRPSEVMLHPDASEQGGLSGPPLQPRADELTRALFRVTRKRIPIIGVGGIRNGKDAVRRIQAGASLLQIYTALIYRGPAIIRHILDDLSWRLGPHGVLDDVIGSDA